MRQKQNLTGMMVGVKTQPVLLSKIKFGWERYLNFGWEHYLNFGWERCFSNWRGVKRFANLMMFKNLDFLVIQIFDFALAACTCISRLHLH